MASEIINLQTSKVIGHPVTVGGKTAYALAMVGVDSSGALGDVVVGNIAHDGVDSGNPVKVGGVGSASPALVAVGDRTNLWTSLQGAVVVSGANQAAGADAGTFTISFVTTDSANAGRLNVAGSVFNGTTWDRARGDVNGTVVQPALSSAFWNYAPPVGGIVNSTAGVTAKAAAGAGVRNYIKSLQLTADALGVATEFVIRDGAAGTVLARVKVNTGGLAASGTTIFDPPLRGSANTLVEIATLTATVTGGVFVNLQGYTGT